MTISKDDHPVRQSEMNPYSLCAEEVRWNCHELHKKMTLEWIEVAILEAELKIENTVKDENANPMKMCFVASPDQGCICPDEKDLHDSGPSPFPSGPGPRYSPAL